MSKLIVVGSVNGQFAAALGKLAALQAKNRFACCIATGNVFGEADDDELDALLAGRVAVPLTTYFTVGTRAFPSRVAALLADGATEVCHNLHYLGKRSVTKTADGLRIVALGGLPATEAEGEGVVRAGPSTDVCLPFHAAADATSLRGAHGTDILLTAAWPRGITAGSHAAPQPAPETGMTSETLERAEVTSDGIADLVAALRPRYHLTASRDVDGASYFYEREGFFHPERADDTHSLAIDVTRFLSLAPWGNAQKAKALYAFVLPAERPALVPAGCTASPFLGRGVAREKRKAAAAADETFSRFAPDERRGGGRGKRRRRQASPPPGPERCFFCLSNPSLPTHMVACIGDDAYVATAKGPLPARDTFADEGLTFPGHMLIVPLSHAATTAAAGDATDPGAAARTRTEMTRFRDALQTMFDTVSEHRLGAVTWEISRQRNVHVHWQTVPVPAAMVRDGLVEAAFRVEAAHLHLPALVEGPDTDTDSDTETDSDCVRIWLWAGGASPFKKSLVLPLDADARFDLQYARRAVAKLLGLEGTRGVWQDCVQTEADETADATAFRAAFAPWDFTLE